jgi:hypothetical protein
MAMVINGESASQEMPISQQRNQPKATANQRATDMTSCSRDLCLSTNHQAGNNNQATSL